MKRIVDSILFPSKKSAMRKGSTVDVSNSSWIDVEAVMFARATIRAATASCQTWALRAPMRTLNSEL